MIREASVNLAAHGQYIENIHLQPYANEEDFYTRIYPLYLALLDKARVFMKDTSADPARTMLFISAGFDACEHEHQGMQRHDRRVPASFYARYTKDIAEFADAHTGGKVISVLEGGYGDRALTSAALGHAVGLMGREGAPEWWSVPELELLERAVKKRRKGRLCALPPDLATRPHIARAHALLSHFEAAPPITPAPSAAPSTTATPSTNQRMTLRERRPKLEVEDESPRPAPRRRQPKSNAATPAKVELERERERETSPTPMPQAAPVPVLVKPSLPIDPANMYPSPTPSAPSPEDALQVPRVILRIPARTPPPPESVNDKAPSTPVPTPKGPVSIPAADSKPKPPQQPPQQLQSQLQPQPQPQPQPVVQPNSFRPIAPQAVALPPSQPRSSASAAASGAPSGGGQGMRGPLPILSPMPTSHTSQPQYFAPPQPYQHHEAFAPAHHAPPMPGWAAPPQAFGLYPTLPREAAPPPHNPSASSFLHQNQNVPPQQFSNGHGHPSLMSHANFRPSDMHSPHQPRYPAWPQQEDLYGMAAQNLGTPGAPPQSQSQSQSQAQSDSTQNAPPKHY